MTKQCKDSISKRKQNNKDSTSYSSLELVPKGCVCVCMHFHTSYDDLYKHFCVFWNILLSTHGSEGYFLPSPYGVCLLPIMHDPDVLISEFLPYNSLHCMWRRRLILPITL